MKILTGLDRGHGFDWRHDEAELEIEPVLHKDDDGGNDTLK